MRWGTSDALGATSPLTAGGRCRSRSRTMLMVAQIGCWVGRSPSICRIVTMAVWVALAGKGAEPVIDGQLTAQLRFSLQRSTVEACQSRIERSGLTRLRPEGAVATTRAPTGTVMAMRAHMGEMEAPKQLACLSAAHRRTRGDPYRRC